VAGIIFAALGIEQTLAHVAEPLGTIPAVALCGGIALYLLGHNAFRMRVEGSVSVPRLVVAVVCLALIAVGVSVSVHPNTLTCRREYPDRQRGVAAGARKSMGSTNPPYSEHS
jgi:low temperature requirement protein LtrA